MEMKIGDAVSVVDDLLQGIIVAAEGRLFTIEDEHGFRYQYSAAQLVPRAKDLYENVPIRPKKEPRKASSKKHNHQPLMLDLHFDNLVPSSSKKYDAFERLFMQRQKLVETIDFCRRNNLKKLEIVHGIGDGVLQQMVYDVLDSQTNLEYHDKEILHHQSGAVMVYLK